MGRAHAQRGTAVLVVAVLVAIAATVAGASSKRPSQAPERGTLYYYNAASRVRVQLAMDELSLGHTRRRRAADLAGVPGASASLSRNGRRTRVRYADPAPSRASLQSRADAFGRLGRPARAVLYGAAGGAGDEGSILTNRLAVKTNGRRAIEDLAADHRLRIVEAVTYSADTYIAEMRGGRLLGALEVANALYESGDVEFATPLIERPRRRRYLPGDPLFGDQWHLRNTAQTLSGVAGNDIAVENAWDDVTGAGVTIGVVDDGLEAAHPDLACNARTDIDIDVADGDDDATPMPGYAHGTEVAGLAAACDNSVGGVGVAFDAELVGIRLIDGSMTDADEAAALSHQVAPADPADRIDISSNSWGLPDGQPGTYGPLVAAALANAVTHGRGGLGTVFVFAAGNGACVDDDINLDGYPASRHTIAVGASGADGSEAFYSEDGSAMLVHAPSSYGNCIGPETAGLTTTTLSGTGPMGSDYADDFGGTSAATPVVAGVVALMLEANPALGHRDVQHILVETAAKNDVGHPGWFTNGAGHDFNHAYGFGRVHAGAAVAAAQTWAHVGAEEEWSASESVPVAIPDAPAAGIQRTLSVSTPAGFTTEYVEVTADIEHTFRGDLEIALVSPDGTRSVLVPRSGDGTEDYSQWLFTTAANWGESGDGVWTLEIEDQASVDEGTLQSWSLRVYGSQAPATAVPAIRGWSRIGLALAVLLLGFRATDGRAVRARAV